ncbi:dTMP kinase [filamentous cyanobacterium CCP5]|nr:dTMP kinase [filamentous cyanobacterium CCP5]
MRGKLIVFEGGEGAGKSTQMQYLEDQLLGSPTFSCLKAQGLVQGIVATREPGGTALGNDLRRLLLAGTEEIAPTAELLLYAADRAHHVKTVIEPSLQKGFWVLCDRYVDSTTAYQGYGRGLSLGLIEQLNQIATGGLQADLTLWLKLEAEIGLARTHQRGESDRMERSAVEFHRRVQSGFGSLASRHPKRIATIDASPEPVVVARQIQQVVETQLSHWYKHYLTI